MEKAQRTASPWHSAGGRRLPIILPPWLASFCHFLVPPAGSAGSGLTNSIRAISPYSTVASMRGST
ncbi:hypothetical protein EYF80_043633 [Liparis tanakae]|uniref:Uncharacterized protein n=1 Tax=Liparis tanakae TaxID=230148 RepID=A0A4Z2FY04_9TELE|nr:hypothetical protein EYF80_043633 [Liparis tanakae]